MKVRVVGARKKVMVVGMVGVQFAVLQSWASPDL